MAVLVNVTGPIAAGATTLVNRLTSVTSWKRLFEENAEILHPFFSRYSTNPVRYAFHNQVSFLVYSANLHRYFRTVQSQDTIYLQDFCPFEHTEVYAYVQHQHNYLSDNEYHLLLELTTILEPEYIIPKLLVYRSLNQSRLLQSIQKRGRPEEQTLDMAFLDALQARFEMWIKTWTRSPVLRIEEEVDILADANIVAQLGATIVNYLRLPNKEYKSDACSPS